MRHSLAGFTLLEVLVAVLLLAAGLVGALAMQAQAMRTRQDSALLTTALQTAAAAAERIRANAAQSSSYLGFECDTASPAPAAVPSCSSQPCDPQQLAQADLQALRQAVRDGLPGGRARICRDARSWSGGLPQWACSDDADAPLVIKIGWHAHGRDANVALPLVLPASGSAP